jgi:hypothetical protein
MSSPVSSNDAGIIHQLLKEIEERVDEINHMKGIRDNTDEPVHSDLYKIRQACQGIRAKIGTGRG